MDRPTFVSLRVLLLIGAAMLILMVVAVLVTLPKLQKKHQYDLALQYMEDGMYAKAIDYFEDLGDYADSSDRADEAKYRFVLEYFDRENPQTMHYLLELMNRGYKGAAVLYAELSSWKLSLTCLNTDPDDETTVDNVVSKYVDYLHFGGSLEGGVQGSQIMGKLVLALPDGSRTDLNAIDGVLEPGKRFDCALETGLFSNPDTVAGGAAQLQVRSTDTDALLAAWDFTLSDNYIWKTKLLYWNTEEDDLETVLDSVSKYTPYYHFGFLLYGGDPKAEFNITEKIIYPDGSSEERESFWTEAASGKENGEYGTTYLIMQPELMPAGTMKVELYRADTGEALGSFEIQLSDEAAEPAFHGTVSLKFCGDDPEDTETVSTGISRYTSFFRYGYYDSDASSSGEVSLRRVKIYPNGESDSEIITCNFDEYEWYYERWGLGLQQLEQFAQAGSLVVKFYDAVSNQLVGEFTFKVTDDKPEERGYADKITSTFINGEADDTATSITSIGAGQYLHYGLKIEGAVPGETITVQQVIRYPDQSWKFHLYAYAVREDGTLNYDRYWENGVSQIGTLELYLYDHDSYELLASYTIEVTD